jgi:hypothetical protein
MMLVLLQQSRLMRFLRGGKKYLCVAFFALAAGVASAQAGAAPLWYVFPEAVDVYCTPSLQARRAPFQLRSGEKIPVERITDATESGPAFLMFARSGSPYYAPEPLLTRIVEPGAGAREGYAPLLKRLLGIDLAPTTFPIGKEIVNHQTPLPIDYKPADLVRLPQEYWATEIPMRLRKEAAQQCVALIEAAHAQGVTIKLLSAYRSYQQQIYLYMRAVAADGLLQRHTAKPGHSEHQLGTTFDAASDDPRYWLKPEFAQTPAGMWLKENASRFGFVQSLREDNQQETGYSPEPWHFRYIGKGERDQ